MKSPEIKSVTRAALFPANVVLLGVALMGTALVGEGAETPPAAPLVHHQTNVITKIPQPEWETKWGIQVSSLRLTAGGNMIDFRYKVLDPKKAAPLGDRENKAYLIDQATGAKFLVPTTPKIGPLRQKAQNLTAGQSAFVIFVNPGKYVKAGDKVTVVIGDFRVENLVIE